MGKPESDSHGYQKEFLFPHLGYIGDPVKVGAGIPDTFRWKGNLKCRKGVAKPSGPAV